MRKASQMAIPNFGRSYPDHSLDAQYLFRTLPVTEAAASATAFVCEFTGGASANETGVGGGLSGGDLVFTQVNGVAGVDGNGFRAIAKNTNQGFAITPGFLNAFAQSAAGLSFLWRLKDVDPGTSFNFLLNLHSTNYDTVGGVLAGGQLSNANRRHFQCSASTYAASGNGMGVVFGNTDSASSNSADPEFLLLVSMDYATRTGFYGLKIGLDLPTKLGDFLYFAFNRGDAAHAAVGATSSFAYSRDTIIGSRDSFYAPNHTAGVKIKSFTAAKYPCFVPV